MVLDLAPSTTTLCLIGFNLCFQASVCTLSNSRINASADANIIAMIFRIVGLKPKPLSPSIFFSKNNPNSTTTCSLTFETSEKVVSIILLNDDLPLKIPSKTKLYVGNIVILSSPTVIG